jgi:type IV pilus assembly protein PilB
VAFLHQARSLALSSGFLADPDAVRRIPEAIARRYDLLGVASDDNALAVAVPDPSDSEAIERLRFATGMQVQAIAAPREAIRSRVAAAYGNGDGTHRRDDDPPVVRLLNDILSEAARGRVSDVHIEPLPEGGRIRFRVDGLLNEHLRVPRDVFDRLLVRLKLLCAMDIADRRQPQDGRMSITIEGRSVDVRAACLPTIAGEQIVLRLFDREAMTYSIQTLGMPQHILAVYTEALRASHGCIIVCGPTGSGKTTTLYASLASRSDETTQIWSIEDPVELRMPGISQVQVSVRAGLTFAAVLKSVVRVDPDAIMLGEIRDSETAHAAVAASLSGRLLFTSLHAADAIGALERLVEFGIDRKAIASSVRFVIAQRLLRTSASINNAVGRVPVFETLSIDDPLRQAIAEGVSFAALRTSRRMSGAETLHSEAERCVRAGLVDRDEVRRVVGSVAP